jgi:CHAT domain-containing protein/Tfp pilus assembly protein PilF
MPFHATSGPVAPCLSLLIAVLLSGAVQAAVPGQAAGPAAAPQAAPVARQAAPPEVAAVWQHYLGLKQSIGKLYRGRGMQVYESGDLRSAAALLSHAVDFDPGDTEALGRLGFARKEIGDYEGAAAVLRRAIQQDPGEYQYHWWLGDVLRLLGDYEAAAQSMMTSRDLAPAERFDEINDYVAFTQGLSHEERNWVNFDRHVQMAMRHDNTRRSRRCIQEYLRAAALAPDAGDENNDLHLRKGLAYVNVGTQYTFLKEPDVAVDYFERSIPLFEDGKHDVWLMRTHQNIAIAYRVWAGQDQPRRTRLLLSAAKHWERALELARAAEDVEYVRYAQGSLLRDLADAKGLEDEQVAKLREVNLTELPFRGPVNDYSVAAVALGELACRVAENDFAGQRIIIEMITEYYDEPRFLLDSEEAARLKLHLASVYNHQGHHKLAIDTAQRAAERFAAIRDLIDADAYNRSDNEMNLRHAATVYLRAAIASGSQITALEGVERFRETQQRNLFGSKVRDETRYTDPAAESALLRDRIVEIEAALSAADAARDADRAAYLRERLAKDQARLAWLDRGVVLPHPHSLAYRPPAWRPTEVLQKDLPADVTVVSYAYDRIGGVALIQGPEVQAGVLLDGLDQATVDTLVHDLRGALADDPAKADELLGQAYDLLVAPLREHLKTPVLHLAPDAALNYLPFEALHTGGKALIDDFTIAYVPSGSQLADLLDRNRQAKERLRVVSPAAVDAPLADAFGAFGEASLLTGDEATESAARAVDDTDVIHIASPADFSPADVMLSALLLAPDAQNDGYLHAAEWLGAHLPVALAVLDMDYTLDKAAVRGTDLSAFIEAVFNTGAAAVVTNLWTPSVGDRHALLADFHKNLQTMGRAEALRAAKQAQRKKTPGHAWTAFTLRGDHR